MELIDDYINHILSIKRYSKRTAEIYRGVLEDFSVYLNGEPLVESLCPSLIRSYEVYLLEKRKLGNRSVGLHISVLSSFCRFLCSKGILNANPTRSVTRPKVDKPLPIFYRTESMMEYFHDSSFYASRDALCLVSGKDALKGYKKILDRMIISLLFHTGMRRSELIGLKEKDIDWTRELFVVHGKGDKQREIPIEKKLTCELTLYLRAKELANIKHTDGNSPLLATPSGRPLYPEYVDRAVKSELGKEQSITVRKSPHVLRHTIATELLNAGAQLNSIKQMLGHSSLAATQIYTHNSIEKLKQTYNQAHPLCPSSKK